MEKNECKVVYNLLDQYIAYDVKNILSHFRATKCFLLSLELRYILKQYYSGILIKA